MSFTLYINVLTGGKHLNDRNMYLRGEVLSHNTISTSPHLLRCMYQARKVSGHVLCVSGIEFPSFYDFAMHFGLIQTAWYSLFFILWCTLQTFGNSDIYIPRMSLMDQSRFLFGFVMFNLYFSVQYLAGHCLYLCPSIWL